MKCKTLLSCMILAVMVLFLAGMSRNALAAGAEVGDIVDNFTLPDFNGNNHTLYDYEGQVIFINFWAVI